MNKCGKKIQNKDKRVSVNNNSPSTQSNIEHLLQSTTSTRPHIRYPSHSEAHQRTTMQCLEARIASFEAVTRPKRSAKVGFPLSAAEYPHLTPSSIAGAGFYHYPGRESETDSHDTCRCFFCGLILGGWDQDDDPFAEHVKREGDCAWKELVCRLQVDKVEGGPGRLRYVGLLAARTYA